MAYLRLKVIPSASRDAVVGWQGDVLRLCVTAPAQRGKANEAVLCLLAAALGIERQRLGIVRGQTSRHKLVLVDGLDDAEIRARLLLASNPTLSAGPGLPGGGAHRPADE